MSGYNVTIELSSKELTAKERVSLKNLDECVKLDESITPDSPKLLINVDAYVVLNVHNEKSDNKDYKKYVLIDKDGTRYVTGSEPLFSTFINIFEEMVDVQEDWELAVYKRDSNNYKGKQFLTCSIV